MRRLESWRFSPAGWTKYLVPALLVLLLIILSAVLLLVVFSMFGLIPGT